MLNRTISGHGRRLVVILYLVSAMFIVAHIVNAFVANELHVHPIDLSDPISGDPSPTAQQDIDHTSNQGPSISSSSQTPQQQAQAIAASGLFLLPQESARDTGPGGRTGTPAQPLDLAKKVSLLGTAIGGESGGSAVFEDLATKEQRLIRLHHSLPNVGELAAIEKDRVLLRSGGQEEWILSAAAAAMANPSRFPFPDSSGSESPPQPTVEPVPTRRLLKRQDLVKWQPRVYGDRFLPYVERGKVEGMQVHLGRDGFFGKLDLETNDVLRRINGVEIPTRAFLVQTIVPQLKREDRITLDFIRNGQPRTLSYVVE